MILKLTKWNLNWRTLRMTFDYKNMPARERNIVFQFFEYVFDHRDILEQYKKDGIYRMKFVHEMYNPYISMWKRAYGIVNGAECYELTFNEENIDRFTRMGKEIKMWRNLQAIKNDF